MTGAERVPLFVGGDRDRDPLLVARARVHVLRRRHRTTVAVAGELGARRAVLHDHLGGRVERGLDHRRPPRADPRRCGRARPKREDRGEHRVRRRERVARAAGEHRRSVDPPGDPGHAGDRLHRLCEAGAVAPRAVEAVRRHAGHHDARVHRAAARRSRARSCPSRAGCSSRSRRRLRQRAATAAPCLRPS